MMSQRNIMGCIQHIDLKYTKLRQLQQIKLILLNEY
jgi:hypothetical protein